MPMKIMKFLPGAGKSSSKKKKQEKNKLHSLKVLESMDGNTSASTVTMSTSFSSQQVESFAAGNSMPVGEFTKATGIHVSEHQQQRGYKGSYQHVTYNSQVGVLSVKKDCVTFKSSGAPVVISFEDLESSKCNPRDARVPKLQVMEEHGSNAFIFAFQTRLVMEEAHKNIKSAKKKYDKKMMG